MIRFDETTRQFSVYARPRDHHHARVVQEASFEAAAVAYLEGFHSPMGDGLDITVIVREIGTDHEHCFKIDLAGDISACG